MTFGPVGAFPDLIGQYRDWITPTGFLDLEAKQAILARQTYGLHACRIEAFGIAVAEMASMGCVPLFLRPEGRGKFFPSPSCSLRAMMKVSQRFWKCCDRRTGCNTSGRSFRSDEPVGAR